MFFNFFNVFIGNNKEIINAASEGTKGTYGAASAVFGALGTILDVFDAGKTLFSEASKEEI